MEKPTFIEIGDTFRPGGYNWQDYRMYCRQQNWHVPIWKARFILTENFIHSFMEGVSGYSFTVVPGPCSIPVFIFKFPPPIGYWISALNANNVYPEIIHGVLKDRRDTINILLIDKNKVVARQLIKIDNHIMEGFYQAVEDQLSKFYTIKTFHGICGEEINKQSALEFYMRGTKGSLLK